MIKTYNLNENSKLLDIGCGGFLLYEIKKFILKIEIKGNLINLLCYSKLKKSEIKNYLSVKKAQDKFDCADKYFDLVISIGCLHNLEIFDLSKSLKEIQRISKIPIF